MLIEVEETLENLRKKYGHIICWGDLNITMKKASLELMYLLLNYGDTWSGINSNRTNQNNHSR